MAARRKQFSMDHPIIVTFLIFAIIGFMSLAAEVLKPLALAILLSFALAPFVRRLELWRVPKSAAVVLTVVGALGLLGVVVYVVQGQLSSLAYELPKNQANINKKLSIFRPSDESALAQIRKVGSDLATNLDKPAVPQNIAEAKEAGKVDGAKAAADDPAGDEKVIQDVRVVEQPGFRERLEGVVGPILEPLTVGSFVLILVLFLLMGREDLGDRLVQLFGRSRVTVTTRTMDEVGQRISKYLAMWGTVNACFGLIIGLGLWAIGIPYAVLWGFLAASMRFIPYVGAAVAFILPFVYSVAHFDGWREPLLILLLFGVIETAANSFLEPIIYGKTTGVSALGLLVAAMFWTWLWGGLGLLLSTPLTVCLAVLGKYVPGLGIFATLLGEETHIDPVMRFYQRLLAMDQDGASAVVEAELKQHPRVEVCDSVLIPTLTRAERDYARDELDDRERAFIWRVIGDLLAEMEETPEVGLASLAASGGQTPAAPVGAEGPPKVVGLAANDTADALSLRMLALTLDPAKVDFEVVAAADAPYKLVERVAEASPALVVASHLPPEGLTPARYLVRRLHARFPEIPIIVGRWSETGNPEAALEQLTAAGASRVIFHLDEAREAILAAIRPKSATLDPSPMTGTAGTEDRLVSAVG